MAYEGLSLLEFQRRYNSQEACLQAIAEARWPRGFICPHCQHNDGYRLSKRRAIQCTLCRRQTSITAGTLFHKSKTPLISWFWLIFLMSQDKGGISTKRAAALLDLHYSTAWFMMHKLREAMAVRQNGHLLSGLVEIDEAHLGGKAKGKRAGGTNKKQVCVVVERLNRQAGDAVLIVLPDRSGEALKTAVASVLEPMTHIRTDGLPKNSVLHGLAAKLNMDTIGKNYDEQGALENVDRVISLLRRFLMGTYHQYCSRAHLQRFLNEFAFRFNRRYKWSELFDRTLSAAALCPPVQYAAIS